jgi:hypothetical protein
VDRDFLKKSQFKRQFKKPDPEIVHTPAV